MSARLSKEQLHDLRNRIQMIPLIVDILELIYKTHDGHFRFMCPVCRDFDSAVNTQTNLARCFRCERNFNPIDMVMLVKHYSFIQAVQYLQPILWRIEACAAKKPVTISQKQGAKHEQPGSKTKAQQSLQMHT